MSKVKKAIFEDEESLQSIKELDEDINENDRISEEEIEKLFTNAPIQVEEIPQVNTGMVEIVPLRDSSFFFGGTWYHITKGKRQLVSTYVRDFLLQNKQNPRIKDIY